MQQVKSVKKLIAMTLAEMLIAIVILGTVSALTVPVLKLKADKTAMEAMFKKAYYLLDASIDMYVAQNAMDTGVATFNKTENGKNLFIESFKKNASLMENSEITGFAQTYRNFDGVGAFESGSYDNVVITEDGIAYSFNCKADSCEVAVDLNSSNPPNAEGYDYFVFSLSNNGVSGSRGHAEGIISGDWKFTHWDDK